MATPTTKTELLKSQEKELVKSYCVLDGQDRPTTIYTAQADATTGIACTRVDYTYASSTSSTIIKMRESYDVWDSTWDI